jgi:putative transposase
MRRQDGKTKENRKGEDRMWRGKQLQFPLASMKASAVHGGEHSIGKRKKKRPIAIKKPMHVVMRASKAKGVYSLRSVRNKSKVEALVWRYAKRFSVRIYEFSVQSNHIHIVLKARHRSLFQGFLRALAGNIACQVMGARKGEKKGRFWDLLAFSRIVEWGRAFKAVLQYVLQNEKEARGETPYQRRRRAAPM